MSKDDFINAVTEKLSTKGFQKMEDRWTKKIVQRSNITVNGQPFGNDIETDLNVSIFADAKIDNDDAAQMLFEAQRGNAKILSYEEIITYDNIDTIDQVCHQLFGI